MHRIVVPSMKLTIFRAHISLCYCEDFVDLTPQPVPPPDFCSIGPNDDDEKEEEEEEEEDGFGALPPGLSWSVVGPSPSPFFPPPQNPVIFSFPRS